MNFNILLYFLNFIITQNRRITRFIFYCFYGYENNSCVCTRSLFFLINSKNITLYSKSTL